MSKNNKEAIMARVEKLRASGFTQAKALQAVDVAVSTFHGWKTKFPNGTTTTKVGRPVVTTTRPLTNRSNILSNELNVTRAIASFVAARNHLVETLGLN